MKKLFTVLLFPLFLQGQVVVFNETFNSLAGWTVVNANTNTFWNGTQPASPTGNCLFVSNGSGYGYNNTPTDMIIWKEFCTAGLNGYATLEYDIKVWGNNNTCDSDYVLFIQCMPYNNPNIFTNWTWNQGGHWCYWDVWTHMSYTFPPSTGFQNQQHLYFGWRWVNNGSNNSAIPFALDNFKLTITPDPLGTFNTLPEQQPYLIESDNPIISITDLLGRSATSGLVIVQRKYGKAYKAIIETN
jgi:hypothetical protein